MSQATLASATGQLPARSSVFCYQRLSEFLPGPRLCLQLLVCGVGMFVGGCFLVWFCYLPLVVVTLAPFLAAQMFCGFQAKRLENVPSQRVLLKVWAWEPRLSFLGLLVTCCNEVWAFACNSLCPGWRVRMRRWQGPADSPRGADAVCSLTPLLLLGKCQSDVARSPHLVSSKETTKLK